MACPPEAFARAMAHLTALKRTADLTKVQLSAWQGVLGHFRAEIVNAAVLEMVLTETRFPEVGDLYQICRRLAIKRGDIVEPYSPHGTGETSGRPTAGEIKAVAERLGLEV